MFSLKDKSVATARPKSQTVHGITVKKQSVGAYAEIMQRMGGILLELLNEAFPGKAPSEVIQLLTIITADEFKALVVRLLAVLPDRLLAIIAEILGVDVTAIKALSPAELMRVWKTFWDLNDLTYFFSSVRSAVLPMLGTKSQENTGSNASRPLASQLASASAK